MTLHKALTTSKNDGNKFKDVDHMKFFQTLKFSHIICQGEASSSDIVINMLLETNDTL